MSEIYISESDFRNRYQYEPSDLLGEGGFAQVYKAFDKQFEEYVALKFYNKGDQGKYDVLHEMKDSRKFAHPNIIRVHDAFIVRFEHTGGHSYVQVGILEFANGGNLRDFVNTSPSEESFINVLKGILNALDYLHRDKKIIHRDLSPENILMYIDGDRWIPKIADFGISKKIDFPADAKDQKKSTQLLGKVDYMAPEQFYPEKYGIKGEINTNVDLWSFGVILYELFTHRKPFGHDAQDNPMKIIQSITNDAPDMMDDIPEPYRSVIKRCLEKDANVRAKSSKELIDILEKSTGQQQSEPAETAPITEYRQKKKKSYLMYILIPAVLIIAVIGFIILKPSKDKKTEETSLAEITSTPAIDQEELLKELNYLIKQERYNQAINQINKLPEDIKSLHEFREVYDKCISSKQIDSLMAVADKLFKDKKYPEATKEYHKILSGYNPDNKARNLAQNKIKIIDSLSNPAPINENIEEVITFRFSVDVKPSTKIIKLRSIENRNNYTVITLLLYANDDIKTTFSGPGTNEAFYIEYTDRGSKRTKSLRKMTGIRTGELTKVNSNANVKLYFDKLPANIRDFNLFHGKKRIGRQIYFNFIGIHLR